MISWPHHWIIHHRGYLPCAVSWPGPTDNRCLCADRPPHLASRPSWEEQAGYIGDTQAPGYPTNNTNLSKILTKHNKIKRVYIDVSHMYTCVISRSVNLMGYQIIIYKKMWNLDILDSFKLPKISNQTQC